MELVMDNLRPTIETIERAILAPPVPALQPGSILGEWRIEQQIGEGGMGTVYSAVHTMIGKRAALKVIRARVAEQLHAADRFLQEARIVNQIQHPNIVDIFALGRLDDGRPYLVMELLHGESLGDRLDRGRVSAPEAIEMLLQICQALAAAHACGVVHRDLKPDNIFLAGPTVKLLDWGIAKMKDRPADAMDVTGEGSMVGTPRYIAPEQARGLPVDERTDIYSLGCIAHELFLESPPFTADNVADLLVAHLREPVAPPSEVWPDIPAVLDRLIVGMLEKDAATRMSLAQVIDALEQARVELGSRVGLAQGSGPVIRPPSARMATQTPVPMPVAEVLGHQQTELSDIVEEPRRRRSPVPRLVAGTLALACALLVARTLVHYEPLARPTAMQSQVHAAPLVPVEAIEASITPDLIPVVEAVPSAAVHRDRMPQAKKLAAHPDKPATAPTKAKRAPKRVHPDATIDPFAE